MLNAKGDTLKEIEELEKQAEDILKMKKQLRQRRPIVIEFCGSPKSGKTSCINSLNLFLKRNGFKTGIVTEQASVCPIRDKHNPTFNTWTVNSTISELNALLDPRRNEPVDIIICDRAIFDSVCWFEWMYRKRTLDKYEFETILNYVTLPRWSNKIDLIYVFKATPEVSIQREYAHLLTRKPGSIMNLTTLSEYIECIDSAKVLCGDKFRMIQEIDTSKLDQNDVSAKVTRTILYKLKELLIEKVGYIKKDKLKLYGFDCDVDHYSGLIHVNIPLEIVNYEMREAVEENNQFLQIIPIAVITDSDHKRVLILRKQKQAVGGNSPERDSFMIWAGGHMREEDQTKEMTDFEDLVKETLRREIEEELGISISLDELSPYYIYNTEAEKSRNHLAVCYIIEKDLERLRLSIDKYELVQNKGRSKSGIYVDLTALERNQYSPMESWSRIILKNIFGIDINDITGEQMTLKL